MAPGTRNSVESTVCDLLCDAGYAVAWTAEPDRDELRPRTWAGASAVLRDITFSLGDDAETPCARAARRGNPEFLDDVQDLFETALRDRATTSDLRSGCAPRSCTTGVPTAR